MFQRGLNDIMRRKRSSTIDQGHQTKIINVNAVVVGLDGVGKSGELTHDFDLKIRLQTS